MKLSNKQKVYIRSSFSAMKTETDLLNLLNYCKSLLIGKDYFPFNLNQIYYYSNLKTKTKGYHINYIRKKNGGLRLIHKPCKGLKLIQQALTLMFECLYIPNHSAFGFIKGKSIKDNAQKHIDSNYVYNIDLKDFFPTINQARLWGRLKHPPFNLNENNNNSSLARIISSLCTVSVIQGKTETDNFETKRIEVLPQGAPTSPIISNLICEKLDYKLDKLARNAGVNYSRYADDITFSCQHSLFNSKGKFTKEIESIITKEGFSINPSKTRLQKRGWTQQVTGLVVNEKVNVPKIYVKEIRKWLYLLESYDYDKATNYFNNDYRKNKGNALRKLPKIETVLEGKLLYLIMIKGANNSATKNLMLRFKKIKDTKLKSHNQEMLFDEVLTQVLNGNLTVAMQIYLKGKIGK